MSRLRLLPVLVLPAALLALATVSCDSGSAGPGSYSVEVRATEGTVGAALLLISGEGIREATAAGSTQLWSHAAPDEAGALRVLLVDPGSSGSLTFRVQVEDLDRPQPQATILELADRDNERRLPDEGVEVRIRR